MFDIHKIKPVHGWREFLGEVGIIVLGVLIALSAEQIVEIFHIRSELRESRERLADNLASIVYNANERDAIASCLGHRLEQVAQVLDVAGKTGRIPPLGPIGNPPTRDFQLFTWDALNKSGLASHIPKDELIYLGEIASAGVGNTKDNDLEMLAWAHLSAVVGPGRVISHQEIGSLEKDLTDAVYYGKSTRLTASQMADVINALPNYSTSITNNPASKLNSEQRAAIATKIVCQPIGPAPKVYGLSAWPSLPLLGSKL